MRAIGAKVRRIRSLETRASLEFLSTRCGVACFELEIKLLESFVRLQFKSCFAGGDVQQKECRFLALC